MKRAIVTDSIEKQTQAVELILRYGTIDGAHHKEWVLDQVLRILTGAEYDEIVALLEADGYSWSEGIPP